MNRSKVLGMLIGGAIGDALGAPIETWPPEKTAEVHGGPITCYVPPIGHKWFKPEEFLPGMTTDDTQLTIATMEGLILGKEEAAAQGKFAPYMDKIADRHIEASKNTVGGWGKTTTESVRRLSNGVHWEASGKTTDVKMGTGNGVPMKCSHLAAWLGSKIGQDFERDGEGVFQFNQRCVDFSAMTHYTQMSAFATIVHCNLMYMLLWMKPGDLIEKFFFDLLGACEEYAEERNKEDHTFYDMSHLNASEDCIKKRLFQVWHLRQTTPAVELPVERLRQEFNNGSCYLYDSLPFAYAMFLRDKNTLQSILDVANAGGDSDTNAKIVGEMIGAYHGVELFETPENRWAIEGLRNYDTLMQLADRFCKVFEID